MMHPDDRPPGEAIHPRCPDCKIEMPQIQWNLQGPVGVTDQGPPAVLIAFFCPACYVVINCQLLPLPTGPVKPPIVIPGQRFR